MLKAVARRPRDGGRLSSSDDISRRVVAFVGCINDFVTQLRPRGADRCDIKDSLDCAPGEEWCPRGTNAKAGEAKRQRRTILMINFWTDGAAEPVALFDDIV